MNVGCVILAAGNASRFGTNKLTALFHGRELIRCCLDCLPPELRSRVIVTQHEAVAQVAKEYEIPVRFNAHPELGISFSVRLGTEMLLDCDGILYLVGDQPLLKQTSVCRMLQAFVLQPDHIVALARSGQPGNPCLFPKALFPELMALRGDRGGKQVLRRHMELLCTVEAEPEEMEDADTPEDLLRISRLHRKPENQDTL